jgi:hypothetical protein
MKRKLLIAFLSLLVCLTITLPQPVPSGSAQIPDAANPWQSTAAGLKSSAQNQNRTAGLGFMLSTTGWPSISAFGGVQNVRGEVARLGGIQLGQIKHATSTSPTLSAQVADWSTNQMSFSADGQTLQVWASRLSPALLVQSTQSTLRFFTGNVARYQVSGSGVNNLTAGLVYPKYAAYANTSGQVPRLTLTGAAQPITLNEDWLLVWYGTNSGFTDSKKPLSFSGFDYPNGSNALVDAYQADIPVLFRFQNRPTSIKQSPEGGIELGFSNAAGSLVLMPLMGRNNPSTAATENWTTGLNASLLTQIRWWSTHLSTYPTSVQESYSYDTASDTASIQETLTFTRLTAGGTSFAPLPPMLSLARASLGINFSAAISDSQLKTEFGPYEGVEDQSSYTWSLQGLSVYTNQVRVQGTSSPPSYLLDDLSNQVTRLTQGGHYAPWIYADHFPKLDVQGDIYSNNPADLLYIGSEIADALAEPQKSQLISYLKSERAAYPPETLVNLPLAAGAVRGPFSISGSEYINRWIANRPDVFETRVHLYNFYALARYYRLIQEPMPTSVATRASQVLDQDMREQDWATFYWFNGYQDRLYPTVNANRHFAGLVGAIRLFMYAGSPAQETQARALLAKSAVLSVGMNKFIPYLYASQIQQLPASAAWQPAYSAGNWSGFTFNYNWTGASDDHRTLRSLDQFGMRLEDDSQIYEDWTTRINAHLTAYTNLTPELGRLLSNYAPESLILAQKISSQFPVWYSAFDAANLGVEHDYNHPGDAYQVFLAKDWIQSASAAQLEQYTDIPWLRQGDLFYIHKVAEAVKAYRGTIWQDDHFVVLSGIGTDGKITLKWYTTEQTDADSWTIRYTGPSGNPASPVSGISGATREYLLLSMQNYYHYTFQIDLIRGGNLVVSSNTVEVFPTNLFKYMPLIAR